jgi:quercetin dioxygenase-like cupin family protein
MASLTPDGADPPRLNDPPNLKELAMRSLVAGTDDAGRSCILTETPIAERDVHAEGPSFRTTIFELRETPPGARPPGRGGYHETGLEPGHADFLVLQMPAGIEHPYHHTDTLNFYTVIEGSVEVILDDGPHNLETSDSLVLPGIDHGWRAGSSGCTLTILNIGCIRP